MFLDVCLHLFQLERADDEDVFLLQIGWQGIKLLQEMIQHGSPSQWEQYLWFVPGLRAHPAAIACHGNGYFERLTHRSLQNGRVRGQTGGCFMISISCLVKSDSVMEGIKPAGIHPARGI